MLLHKTLPQEFVDQIIDELGDAYRNPDHNKRSDHRINPRDALHTCALISENWTDRSRAHLFKEVKIRGDEEGLLPIPPPPIMPYVEKLKIQLHSERYRLFLSRRLLKPFYAAPITYLGITAGTLEANGQDYLVKCIAALSATLQIVVFKSCSLSPHLILDVVSAHPGLKRLHLLGCVFKFPMSEHPIIPHQGTRPGAPDLELGVFAQSTSMVHGKTMAAIARLPYQLGKLDFDHIRGLYATHTTDTLVKTSAELLSSLTVHIVSLKFSGAENHPPFSLEGCFNLSELTLDMERTDSCIVTTSVNILSTLDPLQRNRLERITLTTSCVHRWFCKGPRTELTRVWGDLDIVLSELTKAAIGMRGKRLTFVLVSTGGHKEGCISFGRKWLPKMLPHFHELGSLHVDCGKSRVRLAPNDPRFHDRGPNCTEEDYNDTSLD